jgi:putative PIG3 family NAD(P)H quinone oxidoreductase
MTPAIVHAAGEPLRLSETPVPNPGPGQILIAVAAAGVNRPDLFQRAGLYPPPPGHSPLMGLEAAGHVAAVGPGVSRWREGDAVTALLNGGGYAGHAIAEAGAALPVPAGFSMEEAAALPETVFTVWANVFDTGTLQPGEAFLVHGGASGIGTTAIQMAKAHGARVFTTAGAPDKVALCNRLGADRAINYRAEDFESALKAEGGVDVILDMVGGPYIPKNLAILKPGGRLAFIAFLQGPTAEVNFMSVMTKRLVITGSTLRPRSTAEKARLAGVIEDVVWPWIAAGKLRPVIDRVYPLGEAEAAQARMQAGENAGKIVLRVGGGGA